MGGANCGKATSCLHSEASEERSAKKRMKKGIKKLAM